MNIREKLFNKILLKGAAVALCFVLCFTLIPWVECTGTSNAEITNKQATTVHGEYRSGSEIKEMRPAVYTYDYDDNWLYNSSYDFNYDLIKLSIRLSLTTIHEEYIEDVMTQMGYGSFVGNYTEAGKHNIGYTIASKNIVNANDEEISVVMVAVRGVGYKDEWAGNAICGPSGDHYGFSTAANTVYNAIDAYLNQNKENLNKKIKIWTFGYSRGAAVANLLGCMLNEKLTQAGYGIAKDDIFDFTYEAPQGAIKQTREYKNIVNIVNPTDIVTKVFMSEWGFCRAGNTYYLPSLNADGVKYLYYKKKMVEEYKKILEYNKVDTALAEELTEASYALQDNLDKICHFLAAEFKSRENYSPTNSEKNTPTYEDIFSQAIMTAMTNHYDFSGLLQDLSFIIPGLVSRLGVYWMLNPLDSAFIFDIMTKNYMEPHYPELQISWIDALGEEGLKSRIDKVRYKKLIINAITDAVVTDATGKVVARIIDGVLDEGLNLITSYIDENGQLVIVVPNDEQFTVKLSSDEAARITLTASEYNEETTENEQVVQYQDVALAEGDVLTYTTGEEKGQSLSEDSLVANGEEVIEPDLDVKGDAVKEWTVNIEVEGSGTARGSGVKLDGEYARFIAWPDFGERFLGWYKDGSLVSKKLIFGKKIKGDESYVAKFTNNGEKLVSGLKWWM